MKANELRIGNYVWENYSGEMIVSQIGLSWVSLRKTIELPEGSYKAFDLKPLQLTDDWLKRLGFNYSEERASMSNGFEEWENNGVFIGPLDNENYISDALDQGGINISIKYVHQLQNLYFAMTGKELIPLLNQ